MDKKAEIEELKWALERQLDWIKSADAKLTVLVPLPTAMLGVLLALVERIPQMTWSTFILFFVSAVLLFVSLGFSGLSVVPRTAGPASSNIFFGKIERVSSAEEYGAEIISRSETDYLADIAAQVHVNARIATTKHKLIRRALYSLFMAIAPWSAILYFV